MGVIMYYKIYETSNIWLQSWEGYVLVYGFALLIAFVFLYAFVEECGICEWTKCLYKKITKKE